jgi:hypothetical protein
VVFVELRRPPALLRAASLLLTQSVTAEQAIATRTDQIIHRTISLEEKKVTGEPISRHSIDVWESAERGITARRLYNERGSLIAGDWRRLDGQTLYHHGVRPQVQVRNLQAAILNFEDVWQLSLSSAEFTALIGRTDTARLEERPAAYVITYEGSAPNAPRQGLVRATLTLSRADLHAVEQSLTIQKGADLREYHFVEISYERRTKSAVAPAMPD